MRHIKFFTVTVALMLTVSVASAQKAFKDASGRFIIDNRDAPTGSTSGPKARTTNAINNTLSTNSDPLDDIATAASNATVSRYFEVRLSNTSTTYDWRAAVDFCANLSADGGDWRLPTQRELMIIWICHEKLRLLPNFTAFSASIYWSATEASAISSWVVSFNIGGTGNNTKTGFYRVRCVRDVTP